MIDRPLISNILMDEPVLEGRLAARGSGVGLAPIIPVGMRAVTVRVNDVTGIAGFVLPGMRVDVLVTGPSSQLRQIGDRHTDSIAKFAGAFRRNRDAAGCSGSGHAGPDRHLAGTPEQAETLTLASADARIQLVLRNGSDQTIEKTPGHDIAELYGERAVAQEDCGKRTCTPAAHPTRGGGRSPASASSAARSDRGDSRNAEERGSGRSRRRGKVNHATNETAVHSICADGFAARPVGFSRREARKRFV